MMDQTQGAETATTGFVGRQSSLGNKPAGFWIRFVASFVDGIILTIIKLPLSLVAQLGTAAVAGSEPGGGVVAANFAFSFAIGLATAALYFGWFYANKGASPGKLLFGLQVVNMTTGTYLTFGQAVLRETVGKFVSGIILMIGYIMAGVRSDKRALHDLMVGSQVIRK